MSDPLRVAVSVYRGVQCTYQTLPTVQRQFGTAPFAVADIEAETVQVDDGRDDGQAQTKTAVFVITAVKTLEYRHPFGLRDTGPVSSTSMRGLPS